MSKPRYDKQQLIKSLEPLAGKDRLAVHTLSDRGLDWEQKGCYEWLKKLLAECIQGRLADFGAFPNRLTSATQADDFRWKIVRQAYHDLDKLGGEGLAFAPQAFNGHLTALQSITDGHSSHVRINAAIRGVFWGILRPDWFEVGWELPASERSESSHITVLSGHVSGEPAWLVFWSASPSIYRATSPDRLRRMLTQSIGVPGAKRWWSATRTLIDDDSIRSAYGQAALVEQRHPDTIGSRMIDILRATARKEGLIKGDRERLFHDNEVQSLSDEADAFQDLPEQVDLDMYLTSLPTRDQEILRLYYREDQTDAEIAEALGTTQQAVNKSRNKAIALLRSRLTIS